MTVSLTENPAQMAESRLGWSRALRMPLRALRLRCLNCGAGRLQARWFGLPERCPVCQVRLEREEGYFLGALAPA